MANPVMTESREPSEDPALARDRAGLADRYAAVRGFTLRLCEPLAPEDQVLQNMPDVSPTKWHLAHTTWFFERFILADFVADYRPWHPRYDFLFNSYYNAFGGMHARPDRGKLSRPTAEEVLAYRREIDARMVGLLYDCAEDVLDRVAELVVLGCHHEQQHQELVLTDIKYNFSCSPLLPAYREHKSSVLAASAPPSSWVALPGGIHEIGHAGGAFAFDNESPRHEVLLRPAALASRLVTNGEFLAFIDDGGYDRPELWLDLGAAAIRAGGWRSPLYWYQQDGEWMQFSLGGAVPLDACEPVCHVSYFEADAFARWSRARLPREAEWEVAVAALEIRGNFADDGRFHPESAPFDAVAGLAQAYGDVWEWTSSDYTGYPGYRPSDGALGEYNGKFMCNQYVLRGGSCATHRSHIRPSYRNFFPPDARWQFSGIRLASDA
jgi:ergothioneine biosynthesis protein EgtB